MAEYRVGSELAEKGKIAEALPHLSRALALRPTNPDVNILMGIYERKQGNFPAAIQYFQKAVETSEEVSQGSKARALVELSYVYRQTGDSADADVCSAQATTFLVEQNETTQNW